MKIFSLHLLVVIAIVNADVSQLQGENNGYNYPPNPQPAFHESLVSYTQYQPTSQSQQSAYYQPQYQPQFQYQQQSQYPSQYQYESQSNYQPPSPQQQQYAYEYFPGYQYFPPGSQGLTQQQCPDGTIGEYPHCEFPTPDLGFRPPEIQKQVISEVSPNVLKSLIG